MPGLVDLRRPTLARGKEETCDSSHRHRRVAPDVAQAVSARERVLERSPIEPQLRELMKVRASQINGCGYCLDMHAEAARA